MTVTDLIIFLVIGAVAGWLAGQIMKGGGFGLVGDIIVGVIGSLIGGWLFGVFGVAVGGLIGSIIAAVVGAIMLKNRERDNNSEPTQRVRPQR